MSRFASAPDKHWHCFFGEEDSLRKQAVALDLTKDELLRDYVEPWHAGRPFTVGGRVFKSRDLVKLAKVVHTIEPSDVWQQRLDDEMAAAGIVSVGFAGMGVYRSGTDYTSELLFQELPTSPPPADSALLLRLCMRLPLAAKALAARRKGKTPFLIEDEYDAQDLLHALVRANFKHAVQEEPMQKLANAKSSRADFAIEDIGAIVEVKFARGPADQGRIVTELGEDLILYEKWAPLKTFFYVVYNSADLADPEALEKLNGNRTHNGKAYRVHIVRA